MNRTDFSNYSKKRKYDEEVIFTKKPRFTSFNQSPYNFQSNVKPIFKPTIEKIVNPEKTRNTTLEHYINGDYLDTEDSKITRIDNRIYFYAPITRANAASLIKILVDIDLEHLEEVRKSYEGTPRHIELHMFSEGGDLFASLAVHQNIISLKSPVDAYIDGFISSAAIMIILACRERIMSKTSFLALNSIKLTVWGKLQYLHKCNQNYKKIWDILEELYSIKTNLVKKKVNIREFMNNNQWFSADDALDYGFITKLIE